MAVIDDAPSGLVAAVRDDARVGHLGAFRVDPDMRGSGAGGTLFDAAVGWLVEIGRALLELAVTQGNARAEAMYARRGFEHSGRSAPLREGTPLRERYMAKRVC